MVGKWPVRGGNNACIGEQRPLRTLQGGSTAAHNAHVSMCCTHAQAKGVPLASNQVQYSLLYRVPERNGVADACAAAGATLIAYSPLAQGLLTGAAACCMACLVTCMRLSTGLRNKHLAVQAL